jgi:hypothetical protein
MQRIAWRGCVGHAKPWTSPEPMRGSPNRVIGALCEVAQTQWTPSPTPPSPDKWQTCPVSSDLVTIRR